LTTAPVTVRLDPRRLEQLKAIGSALNLSSTAVIAELIREKIAAKIIAPDIPGITVKRVEDGVLLELSPGHPRTYTAANALRLVATIRGLVTDGEPSMVSLDGGFAVLRQGSGYKIAAPFPGPEISFPADLALDLADLIEAAAK
jgi:hypothetical protein